MPIRTQCPACQAVYQAPETSQGKTIVCKKCRARFPVPAPTGGSAEVSFDFGAAPPRRRRSSSAWIVLLCLALGSCVCLPVAGVGVLGAILYFGQVSQVGFDGQPVTPPADALPPFLGGKSQLRPEVLANLDDQSLAQVELLFGKGQPIMPDGIRKLWGHEPFSDEQDMAAAVLETGSRLNVCSWFLWQEGKTTAVIGFVAVAGKPDAVMVIAFTGVGVIAILDRAP